MKLTRFLFFLFLVVFPFGQLAKLSNVFGLSFSLYFIDLLAFLVFLSWFLEKIFKKQISKTSFLKFKPTILFLLVALGSLFLNSNRFETGELMISSLYLLRFAIYFGFFLALVDLAKSSEKFLNYLLAIGTSFSLFGVLQLGLWPNLKALETLGWDPHFYRLTSTFLDPNFAGLILVFTFLTSLVFFLQKKDKKLLVLAIFLFVCIFLTQSRSSLLALFSGITVICFLRLNLKAILLAAIVLMVGISLVPKPAGEGGKFLRTYSIDARMVGYSNAIEVVKDNPLFGIGFNTYRYVQRDYGFLDKMSWKENNAGAGIDSSLLFVLATTGIVGFFAFFWQGAYFIKLAFRKRTSNEGIIFLSSAGALLVHSLFVNSMFYPWTMGWMAILLASTFQAKESKKQ